MRIRPARAEDRAFVLGLAPRLVGFGSVPGRDRDQMVARDRAVLDAALARSGGEPALFVAEDDAGRPLGFVHLTRGEDYYTDTATAHIADVVVAEAAGGRGVGSALIGYAEEWARAHGFAMLTLNVFTTNDRARELYRRLGFREEWIRCLKHLQP